MVCLCMAASPRLVWYINAIIQEDMVYESWEGRLPGTKFTANKLTLNELVSLSIQTTGDWTGLQSLTSRHIEGGGISSWPWQQFNLTGEGKCANNLKKILKHIDQWLWTSWETHLPASGQGIEFCVGVFVRVWSRMFQVTPWTLKAHVHVKVYLLCGCLQSEIQPSEENMFLPPQPYSC